MAKISYDITAEYNGQTHYIRCRGKPTAQFIVDAIRLKGAAVSAVWEAPGDSQRCLKIDQHGIILDEEETLPT
jgi:hypothetical protein